MIKALLLGGAITVVGIILIIGFFVSVKDSVKVVGTVIDFEVEQTAKGVIYSPILKFTYNGEELTMSTSVGDKKKKEDIGDTVEVYYKEGMTYVIRTKGSNELNNGLYILGCGIVLLVLGIIMYFR